MILLQNDHVRAVRDDNVCTLVLCNSAERNVLNDAAIAAMHAALDVAGDTTTLVLRGEGDGFSRRRPHSPGGHPGGPEAARRALDEVARLNLRLLRWRAPTIAVVHGFAYGAAFGIVSQCDIAIAAESAEFSFPEITYNLPPALVASYLRRFTSEKAARYLIMTGRAISATRAREMGLVSVVVPDAALDQEAGTIVSECAQRAAAEAFIKDALTQFDPWSRDAESLMADGVAAVGRWAKQRA